MKLNERIRKIDPVKTSRILLLIFTDIILINLASFLGLFVRFEFDMSLLDASGFLDNVITYSPFHTVITLLIFWCMHLYRSLWRYASVDELLHVINASLITIIVQTVGMHFCGLLVPRSFPVISLLFLIAFIVASRFMYRFFRSLRRDRPLKTQRTMVVGAGRSGAMLLRDLQNSAHSVNSVVCLIDDDKSKKGSYLHGVKVIGGREEIANAVETYHVSEIILALPTATPKERSELVSICQKTNCSLRIIPGLFQLASGEVCIEKVRNVEIEDLLGREVVQVDQSGIGEYLQDSIILVTGGGGSIGSELCRQIAAYHPKELIIFDIYENNVYDLQQELLHHMPELNLKVLIGSVRDEKRVDEIFETYHPDYVFHAAAHKHVPLMEASPFEAIKNNVFGTYHVADAAHRFGTARMILISTDKAVNPTNVMGATKRLCEMIVQMFNHHSETEFMAVRFGNVLGSNGSVIPLFKRQIAEGGPVTVTHKDIIRYFMTIPEAVSLVLQAGAYAQGGEIFVLDMGEAVRIDDLARNMIRLSGYEPDVDIKVVYTGLRPGEKLFEELLLKEEGLRRTNNDLIYVGNEIDFDENILKTQLETLSTLPENNVAALFSLLEAMVPTYQPQRQ